MKLQTENFSAFYVTSFLTMSSVHEDRKSLFDLSARIELKRQIHGKTTRRKWLCYLNKIFH